MFAGVAELVDVLDLGSSAARRGGSSPFTRTTFLLCLFYTLLSHKSYFCTQFSNRLL